MDNNNIKTLAGFKDNRLEIDPKFADKAVDNQGPCIIHLLQTYPLHCPKCGRLMLKTVSRKLIIKAQLCTTSR